VPPRTKAARAAPATYARLHALHPEADCELAPREPFQLLVAVVLSAQTTDVAVNRALPGLFARYPDVRALAAADASHVAELIKTIGMFNQKAKNLVGLAKGIVERFAGEVPPTIDELTSLPGVGRKTANVMLGVSFGVASGVVVDTHVQRLAQRLGWSRSNKPDEIERDLMALLPREHWIMLSHVLIFHGRRVCTARAPACESCGVADACPSAGKAEAVGRKKR
jgi:endonuclease-3